MACIQNFQNSVIKNKNTVLKRDKILEPETSQRRHMDDKQAFVKMIDVI